MNDQNQPQQPMPQPHENGSMPSSSQGAPTPNLPPSTQRHTENQGVTNPPPAPSSAILQQGYPIPGMGYMLQPQTGYVPQSPYPQSASGGSVPPEQMPHEGGQTQLYPMTPSPMGTVPIPGEPFPGARMPAYPVACSTMPTPPAKKKHVWLWILIAVIVTSLVIVSAGLVWFFTKGSGSDLSRIERYYPHLVQPADQWANGFEEAWSVEGGTAYANGDRMVVVSYPQHHGVELHGYDISGSKPELLWSTEAAGLPISQYWAGNRLIVKTLSEGKILPGLQTIDLDTGKMETLKVKGSLLGIPEHYRAYFWPSQYMVCDSIEPTEDAYNGYIPQPSTFDTGCQTFSYSGEELWTIKKTDLADVGLNILNVTTGEIVVAQTSKVDNPAALFQGTSWLAGIDPRVDTQTSWLTSIEGSDSIYYWGIDGRFRAKYNVGFDVFELFDLQWASSDDEPIVKRLAEGDLNAWKGIPSIKYGASTRLSVGGEWEREVKVDHHPHMRASVGRDVVVGYSLVQNNDGILGAGAGLVTVFETRNDHLTPLTEEPRPAQLAKPDLLVVSPDLSERADQNARITAYRPCAQMCH